MHDTHLGQIVTWGPIPSPAGILLRLQNSGPTLKPNKHNPNSNSHAGQVTTGLFFVGWTIGFGLRPWLHYNFLNHIYQWPQVQGKCCFMDEFFFFFFWEWPSIMGSLLNQWSAAHSTMAWSGETLLTYRLFVGLVHMTSNNMQEVIFLY